MLFWEVPFRPSYLILCLRKVIISSVIIATFNFNSVMGIGNSLSAISYMYFTMACPPPCSKLNHSLALYPLWCPWHDLQGWTLVYWIHMPLVWCIHYNLQFGCCPIPYFFSQPWSIFFGMSLWLVVVAFYKMSIKTNHMVSASSLHWVASSCPWPTMSTPNDSATCLHCVPCVHIPSLNWHHYATTSLCSEPFYSLPSTLINWCWCNMHEWIGLALMSSLTPYVDDVLSFQEN